MTASDYQHEDLFWALRGGGGNFGVVTSMEFQLHSVAQVYGGPIFYEAADAGDVLRFYREFIAGAPGELGAFFAWQIAPPLPFIPEDRHGETMCAIITCWTGPLEEGEAMLRPLFEVAPVVANHTGPLPYPALNGAFDPLLPSGLQHYWKADFVAQLTDDAIAAHVEHGPRVPVVTSTMHLYPLDGAVQRIDVKSLPEHPGGRRQHALAGCRRPQPARGGPVAVASTAGRRGDAARCASVRQFLVACGSGRLDELEVELDL